MDDGVVNVPLSEEAGSKARSSKAFFYGQLYRPGAETGSVRYHGSIMESHEYKMLPGGCIFGDNGNWMLVDGFVGSGEKVEWGEVGGCGRTEM